MTKSVINNRTDAWKTDVNLISAICFGSICDATKTKNFLFSRAVRCKIKQTLPSLGKGIKDLARALIGPLCH